MVNAIQSTPQIRRTTPAATYRGSANPAFQAEDDRANFWVTPLSFYVFLLVSRVLDLSPIWWLHIPMILLISLILTMFAQGNIGAILSLKIPRFFAAFTAWVLICFPVSSWRGGSLKAVIWSTQAFFIFLLVVHFVRTQAAWRKVATAYAFGVLFAALLSFKYGQSIEGRLALSNGSLADPNEFALTLVIGLPLWWLKMSNANAIRKILILAATLPIFYVFAKTGSRAGLLAMTAVFLVMMWFASASQKMFMAILAISAVVLALLFLPPYLRVRYFTTFSPGADDLQNPGLDQQSRDRLSASLDSGNERQALLRQSINMTFHHPIFGIGPGVFAETAWEERRQESGRGGLMLVTHNTYTQISSETGLPGIFLFGAMLFYCFKYTIKDFRSARKKNQELAREGLFILTSLTGLGVGIFFLSMGYSMLLAVMFGLTASLHNIAEAENSLESGKSIEGDSSASSLGTSSSALPKPRSTEPRQNSGPVTPSRHRRFARLSQPDRRRNNRRKGTDWYERLKGEE